MQSTPRLPLLGLLPPPPPLLPPPAAASLTVPFPKRLLRRTAPPRHLAVTALSSSRNPVPKQEIESEKQNGDGQEDGREITGLDVLWAMQKASAATHKTKNKKKKKKREGSYVASLRKEDDDVDYSTVKPLVIKSEWGAKLEELEKRVQELSQMV